MKNLLKIEFLFLFLLGVLAYSQTGFSWWIFAALFFLPDLSMIGYIHNPKTGACLYNIAHHFGTAVICYLAGNYFEIEYLTIAGIILFSHIAFDRIFGYGLKYTDNFQHTHLGMIGKHRQQ